ncbi:MAG: hypothetical protein V4564_23970, partial [Pseudomonadota bacterium]
MAEDTMPAEAVPVARRPLWLSIVKWTAIGVAGLVLLLALLIVGLNTSPGRRLVANFLGGYTTESGLNIKVGRIDGSIYGAMILTDVRVSDPKGIFLTSPRIDVDWRPFAFAGNHVDVRSATTRLVTVQRSPELKPGDPNAPLLPDLAIDIGRLKIDRLVLAKAVSGATHIVSIDGVAHIADARAQVTANAVALTGQGIAGGDRLALKLDAAPAQNKLDLDAKVQAPAGGLVASMAGLTAPLDFTLSGAGSWKAWTGKAIGTLGGQPFANLSLAANDGTFKIRGTAQPALYVAG